MNRNFRAFTDLKSLELEVPMICLVTGCVSLCRDRHYTLETRLTSWSSGRGWFGWSSWSMWFGLTSRSRWVVWGGVMCRVIHPSLVGSSLILYYATNVSIIRQAASHGPHLSKIFLSTLNDNSYAQANSGFRILRRYKNCLNLEEALVQTCYEGRPPIRFRPSQKSKKDAADDPNIPRWLTCFWEPIMAPSCRVVPIEGGVQFALSNSSICILRSWDRTF
jgi:hypothetical protein